MSTMTEIERIDQLREELHLHNYKYYVENAPVIFDQEFDRLMRELQDLQQELRSGGTPLSDAFVGEYVFASRSDRIL